MDSNQESKKTPYNHISETEMFYLQKLWDRWITSVPQVKEEMTFDDFLFEVEIERTPKAA